MKLGSFFSRKYFKSAIIKYLHSPRWPACPVLFVLFTHFEERPDWMARSTVHHPHIILIYVGHYPALYIPT